jgi:hypothetical protein
MAGKTEAEAVEQEVDPVAKLLEVQEQKAKIEAIEAETASQRETVEAVTFLSETDVYGPWEP